MSQYPPAASFDQSAAPGKGMAIAALICAIVGFCVPLVGLVGVVLGIVALVQANANPQRTGGKGLSIAAIIVGCISMVSVFLLMIAILLPALGQARNTARQLKSSVQMRQIGLGLHSYAAENKDWLPEAGADLPARLSKYGLSADQFISPRAEPGAPDSYIYIPGYNQASLATPTAIVVLYENPKYIPRGQVNVLFADGHVEFFPVADLQRVLDASPKPTSPATTPPSRGKRP